MRRFLLIGATTMMFVVLTVAQHATRRESEPNNASGPNSCPLQVGHLNHQSASADRHFAEMNERGARAMGFDQTTTTHHFRTLPDGGTIEVTVNDPSDAGNLSAIRAHFHRIAREFANGNFTAPVTTHNELPAGAETMRRLKARISYKYEELPRGARVRIMTADAEALRAIHQFFEYQIREHRTGDPPQN